MDENERGNDSCLDKDQVPCFCFSSLSCYVGETSKRPYTKKNGESRVGKEPTFMFVLIA